MSKAVKDWARRERVRLMTILKPVCVLCGTTECLTFDCIKPMGDAHHKGSTDQRMTFYRRQFRAGNLQVLCSSCNSAKQAKEMQPYLLAPLPEGKNGVMSTTALSPYAAVADSSSGVDSSDQPF